MIPQLDEETRKVRSKRVPSIGASVPVKCGVHHPPGTWMHSGSPRWKLSEPVFLSFYGDFITQACVIKPLAIGDGTQTPIPLSCLEIGDGVESSNSLIIVPQTTNAHP